MFAFYSRSSFIHAIERVVPTCARPLVAWSCLREPLTRESFMLKSVDQLAHDLQGTERIFCTSCDFDHDRTGHQVVIYHKHWARSRFHLDGSIPNLFGQGIKSVARFGCYIPPDES